MKAHIFSTTATSNKQNKSVPELTLLTNSKLPGLVIYLQNASKHVIAWQKRRRLSFWQPAYLTSNYSRLLRSSNEQVQRNVTDDERTKVISTGRVANTPINTSFYLFSRLTSVHAYRTRTKVTVENVSTYTKDVKGRKK